MATPVRAHKLHRPMPSAAELRLCRYCDDNPTIRPVDVIVGAHPGRAVPMLIDVLPHPSGRVIERNDGRFRLLGDVRFRKPGVAGYRVHGATMWAECAGEDDDEP